jgi:hypothetical protein
MTEHEGPFLTDFDFLNIVLSREQVESEDYSDTLSVLHKLTSSPEGAIRFCELIDLAVHGYDDDPRGLSEIPEVRRYIQGLDADFPYWLYFLSKRRSSLMAILSCMVPVSRTPDGRRADTRRSRPLSEFLFHCSPIPYSYSFSSIMRSSTCAPSTEIAERTSKWPMVLKSAAFLTNGGPDVAADRLSAHLTHSGCLQVKCRVWQTIHKLRTANRGCLQVKYSSGPALLISFSEGISIASSKRVFGELGWFR